MKIASLPERAVVRSPTSLAYPAFAAIRTLRGRHLFLIDGVGLAAAAWLAVTIPLGIPLGADKLGQFLPTAAVIIAIRLAVNVWFGLYSRLWVHASVPDLLQIVWATAWGTLIAFPVVNGLQMLTGAPSADLLKPAFWFLEFVLAIIVVGGARFAIRAVNEIAVGLGSTEGGARVPALLFGTGREGVLIARSALSDGRAKVLPVGFLDADASGWGKTIAGLNVFGGLRALDEAIRRTGARMLLITMSNAPGSAVREIMAAAQAAGLDVRRVPAVHELLDGTLDASRIRRIRVEDLLTREQVTTHAPGVEAIIRDQVVMVTGAGGSIGSELARQIYALRPRSLVLVDRAESPLYMIERELDLRKRAGASATEISVHMANVVSRNVISRLIRTTRPSVIFHAAACKHVPMMEEHPSESVHVNVAGTKSVLDAAVAAGVERFVLVSTDKAVEPSSVMGATKRLAEWLVAEAAIRTGKPYVAVRFGNVLGSAGSVLPVFERQLERGEPLTVTHADMTRYFMTIQEAGWLILDAAAIGHAGDLFVLNMGEPVRILDMARDLIRLAGREPDDVEIVFTGLRPGEKLKEKLYYDAETVRDTDVPKIWRVLDPQPPPDVRRVVERLVSLADGDREARLRTALFEAVAIRENPHAAAPAEPVSVVSIPARDRVELTDTPHEPAAEQAAVQQLTLRSDDPDDELEPAGAPGPGSPG